MGQYYYVVNVDKREYLHPHRFGDGLKLLEFGCSANGVMTGLAILLADGNGRGGGDLDSRSKIVGRWAGDRIVVAGDYADPAPGQTQNLFDLAESGYTEISAKVLAAMADDPYIADDLYERLVDPAHFGAAAQTSAALKRKIARNRHSQSNKGS